MGVRGDVLRFTPSWPFRGTANRASAPVTMNTCSSTASGSSGSGFLCDRLYEDISYWSRTVNWGQAYWSDALRNINVSVLVQFDEGFSSFDKFLWTHAPKILATSTASSFLMLDPVEGPIDARDVISAGCPAQESDENVNLRRERLYKVKAAFAVSNADLARICRISRTQLYKWLSDDSDIQLTRANWQRLAALAEIADEWNRLSKRAAGDLMNEPVRGKTLTALLSATTLDRAMIRDVLEYLVGYQKQKPVRMDEKLRKAGVRPKRLLGQIAWDD